MLADLRRRPFPWRSSHRILGELVVAYLAVIHLAMVHLAMVHLAMVHLVMVLALNGSVDCLLRALQIEMHWNQLCFV